MEPGHFHEAAARLADTVGGLRVRANAVVGIARGGQPLAEFLGRALGLPVHHVRARRNHGDGVYEQGTGMVDIDSSRLRCQRGAQLLVADDICGTGATLTAVRRHLAAVHGSKVAFACTLCRNEGSTVCPDAWVWDVRDWVVFPWEAHDPGVQTHPLPAPLVVRTARTPPAADGS
jgi:hypoxanthine phosphoribosyltransferase